MTAPRNKKFEWQERLLEAKTLSYTERFIAFVLATKANGVGQEAFMSHREIQERTGASLKTVERARKKLDDEGWVKVTRRGGRSGDGKAWATTYVLAFPERRSAGWGAAAQLNAAKAEVAEKTHDPAPETHLGWTLPLTPQPDKATSQPDISWPQPDTGDGPLDQYSLDSGL